ncbi:MAG TPA: hypothetical protein VFN64_08755 [Burkholderiaceae bacterium]|nr:hypothetical protein [Burkholderiaceae bacterium]
MTRKLIAARVWRRIAQAAIVALGVVTIVGSGGGAIGFPDTTPTFGTPPLLPAYPSVGISPAAPTVQAGTIVRFEATVSDATPPVTYQWRRDGVDIAGATSSIYQLGGAQLGDDGARFTAVAQAANGVAVAGVTLRVSPLPPIEFQDSEFVPANWTVTATAQPAQDGPTHAESQAMEGGNPGPYRLVTNAMTAGTSSLEIVHSATAVVYEPARLGAIYTIDLRGDCSVVSRTSGVAPHDPILRLTFEQAGRTYQPREWSAYCGTSYWSLHRYWSVTEDTFKIYSGPACNAGERCPDFSASAPPLRFGFVTYVSTASGSLPGSVRLGVDNWKVSVWRR